MQKGTAWKKILLFVCICLIAVSGCYVQVEKGMGDLFCTASSQTMLQLPHEHSEPSNMLDEGQWLANDEAVSHVGTNDKKLLPVCRDGIYLSFLEALLAGLAALLAYLTSSVYHSSSCPTHGLSRILAFILNTDGQKDNISFSFEIQTENRSWSYGLRQTR